MEVIMIAAINQLNDVIRLAAEQHQGFYSRYRPYPAFIKDVTNEPEKYTLSVGFNMYDEETPNRETIGQIMDKARHIAKLYNNVGSKTRIHVHKTTRAFLKLPTQHLEIWQLQFTLQIIG